MVITFSVTDLVFSTTLDRKPEPFTQPNIPENKILESCSLSSLWSHLVLVETLLSPWPLWSGQTRSQPEQRTGPIILEVLVLAPEYSQQVEAW